MHLTYLLQLAALAQRSQIHAQMLFFAFIAQGNTKMASYIQLAARECGQAEVYQLSDYRKVA